MKRLIVIGALILALGACNMQPGSPSVGADIDITPDGVSVSPSIGMVFGNIGVDLSL